MELRAADDATPWTKLGLKPFPKTARKKAFTQPCACFDGRRCTIYPLRPRQCARFECGILQRLKTGQISFAQALQQVTQTKKEIRAVKKLLTQTGNSETDQALKTRYADVMQSPLEIADTRRVELHGKLLIRFAHLVENLQKQFLTPPR